MFLTLLKAPLGVAACLVAAAIVTVASIASADETAPAELADETAPSTLTEETAPADEPGQMWDGDGIIEEGEDETAELARAAQNPVANMVSLPFQNNTTFNVGLDDEALNVLNIQPVWPFQLTDDWNLITRTILPVTSQPGFLPGQDRETGLGDMSFTGFLSPSNPDKWPWGKILWGAGPAILFPTATDDRLGADKWALGPSLVALAMPGDWVVGGLLNNVWSVGGSGDQDVNFFFSQWFANYNLQQGWYLVSAPIITANWEASSGNKWTVPVGGGAGKIFRIGNLPPMNFNIQGYYNAVKPDFLGRPVLRVQLQLMFPKRG